MASSVQPREINAMRRIFRSKLTIAAMMVLLLFTLVALGSALGLFGAWDAEAGASFEPPSWKNWFGTDILGMGVVSKVIKGTEIAMKIGFIVAIIAIVIGVVLGAVAGYFGGFIDEVVLWLCGVLTSIPDVMLLMSITFILGKGIGAVYWALGITSWVEICRLIRAEVIRHKNREYILAATAIGATNVRKLFIHIFPNIFHIIIIQFSLLFQRAIKYEVVLSYLGLGVKDMTSWGLMISDAKTELTRGIWWQLVPATMAMFLLVLAFNILSDALRDALDPKLKGK